MFEILDCMQVELSCSFCVVEPLLGCDSVNPKKTLFLYFDAMKPLAEAYAYLSINANNLKAQAVVAKNMFEQLSRDRVSSTQVVKQIGLLIGMECAFWDLVVFTKLIVLTIPVSSTMKRVKNYLCSTISDNRLSISLCIISIERDCCRIPDLSLMALQASGNVG